MKTAKGDIEWSDLMTDFVDGYMTAGMEYAEAMSNAQRVLSRKSPNNTINGWTTMTKAFRKCRLIPARGVKGKAYRPVAA